MANFPDNPSVGSTAIINGISYTYNGSAWDGSTSSSSGGGSGGSSGVSQIIAGSGISVSSNTGNVTVSATGGGGSTGGGSTVNDARLRGDMRNIDELYTGDWAAAFNAAGQAHGGDWWVPTRNYTINDPIIITQDGTKFVGDESAKPKLTFNFTASTATANGITSNNKFALWAAAKFRVRGIYFEWSGSRTDNEKDSALLLFQKGNTNNGQRDDMDSSIDNCTFSNARHNLTTLGAASITYYGRNMRVTGCTFSSGSGSGDIRAIALSYTPNANDTTDGQTLATGGHRRNFVTGNTFHMKKTSVCVEVFKGTNVSTGIIAGLMITSNINDVGGSLLRINNGVYADGTVITGNSCIRSSHTPYVDILSGGKLRSSTITGNSFGNIDATKNNDSDGIHLQTGGEMRDVTITGNAFGAPENACIKLDGTYSRLVITGNIFDKMHGAGSVAVAAGSANNSAVLVANSTDNLTLTSGSTSNWQIANNI